MTPLYKNLKAFAEHRRYNLPVDFWEWLQSSKASTMQEMWEQCLDGRWQLKLLYDEYYPSHTFLPSQLARLDLDILNMTTVGGRTLLTELNDDWGREVVELALNGEAYPSKAGMSRKLEISHGILYQLFAAYGILLSWVRIYGLLGYVRDYHAYTSGTKTFDKRLADIIRMRMPMCPIWYPDVTFTVIYSLDAPRSTVKKAGFGKYFPSPDIRKFLTVTELDNTTCDLAYLDEGEEQDWSTGLHRKWVGDLPYWAFDSFVTAQGFLVHDENATSLIGWGRAYPALTADPYRPRSHHDAAQDMNLTPFPPEYVTPPTNAVEEARIWDDLSAWLTEAYE